MTYDSWDPFWSQIDLWPKKYVKLGLEGMSKKLKRKGVSQKKEK